MGLDPAVLEPDAARQPPGHERSEVEEKLDCNQAQVNPPVAMFGKPPDAEKKKDGERCLKTMQNGQSRAAVDRHDRKRGAKKTVPQPPTGSTDFDASREGGIDQHKAHHAGQRNQPAIKQDAEIERIECENGRADREKK